MKLKIVIDATEKSADYLKNPELLAEDIEEFLKTGDSPLTEVMYKYHTKDNSYEYREPLPVMAARLGASKALDLLVAAGAPDPKKFKAYKDELAETKKLRNKKEITAVTTDDLYNAHFYDNTLLGEELFRQASLDWLKQHPDNPLPCVRIGDYGSFTVEEFIIDRLDSPKLFGEMLSLIANKDDDIKKRIAECIEGKRSNAADFSWQAIQHGWMASEKAADDRNQIVHFVSNNNIDAIKSLVKSGVSLADKKAENNDTPFVFYAQTKEMIQLLGQGGANLKAIQWGGSDHQSHAIANAKTPEALQYLIDLYQEELANDKENVLCSEVFHGVTNDSTSGWNMAMVLVKNGWVHKDYDFYTLAGSDNEERIKWCVENGVSFTKSKLANDLISQRDTKTMNQLRKWGVNIVEPGMLYNALAASAPKAIIEYLVKKGADSTGLTPWGEYEYFGMRSMEHKSLLGLGNLSKDELMTRKTPSGNNFLNSALAGSEITTGGTWNRWTWRFSSKAMRPRDALQDVETFDFSVKDASHKTLLHHIVHGEYSSQGKRLLSTEFAEQLINAATVSENTAQSIIGETWLHILAREQPSNWLHLMQNLLDKSPEKFPLLVADGQGRTPSHHLLKDENPKIHKIKSVAEWIEHKKGEHELKQGGKTVNANGAGWEGEIQAKYKLLERYAQQAGQRDNPVALVFENDPAVQTILLRYILATQTAKIDTNAMVAEERVIDVIERAAMSKTITPETLAFWREKHFNQESIAGHAQPTKSKPRI